MNRGDDDDPLATSSMSPESAVQRTVEDSEGSGPDERPLVGPAVRAPGRYQILGEHGRGGLGRVSRARDRELGRDVAIKELIARGHVDELRFLREALITARLEHPGIVPVHEAGRWPDGTPFYAMKLVSGRSLRDLIAECTTGEQRLSLLHHVIAVADAIAYAHGRNIIHRDLKPANVIVGEFGETVVIDWGLAKDLTAAEELPATGEAVQVTDDLTIAGSVLGTPAYMAPEAKRGEPVDQRADVFAIGVMLWDLCATRALPPGDAGERHRVLRRAGIDRDLAVIIDKALDPDPARRYPDAAALAADLKAFKSGVRIAARSYSLFAMLAHWTRRHRTLAISATAMIVLAAAAAVVFVHNIEIERDRADAALVSAQQERDRARLSEASLLLEKDPTSARDLLAALPLHTPQYALRMSRARQMSAELRVTLSAGIRGLLRAPDGTTAELLTPGGELYRLDLPGGALEAMDHDLTGAVTYRAGQWLYARRPSGARFVHIATPSNPDLLDAGELTGISRLVTLNDGVYALDTSGDLHRFDGKTSAVVAHGVHNIAGDGDVRAVCKIDGDLEIMRGDTVILHRRCPATKSPASMAVVGDDYAALTSDGTLLAARHGRPLELHTGIQGEYELALSSQGVIALVDYAGTGQTWFVGPGGTSLSPGPVHGQPYCTAADGNLAAWGYTDGTVIVLDATTGMAWTFRGHPGPVGYLAIDAANARILTASSRELRVWALKRPASSPVTSMPCAIFHVQLSPDGTRAALDCDDGSVWVWSRDTGAVTPVHRHLGFAYGVQWVKGKICSGGWGDGRVLCSTPEGTDTRTVDSGASRITSLIATADHEALIFGAADGKLWRMDETLHELYAGGGVPHRVAISGDGRLLAWCSLDGSLDVLALASRRLVAHTSGHMSATCSVTWVDDELWTTGAGGSVKRWKVQDGRLTLGHSVQASTTLDLTKVAHGGWASDAGDGVLLVSLDGSSIALRLDLGSNIAALDVSPDLRYVAASTAGEIVVVDMQRHAIATQPIGASPAQQLGFLGPTQLAFSEPTALETLQVDRLDYVPFQPAPEPRNLATF